MRLQYNGKQVYSRRGQQGCPLMMPMYCAMRKEMRGATPAGGKLSIQADYADDGMDGGEPSDVLEVLKEEKVLAERYGARLNLTKMVVYIVGGEGVTDESLRGFEELGIKIDRSMNIVFMKAPVHGSTEFLHDFWKNKMGEIRKTFDGIRKIKSRHIGLYLLRNCANVCRVVYYCRAVPRDMLSNLLDELDQELREVVEEVLGLTLQENQWAQATLPVRDGGLGLQEAREVADAAYVSSRYMTLDGCKQLDPEHRWDGEDGMSAVGQALGRLGLPPEEGSKTSKQLVDALNKTKVQRLEDQAGQVDKARLMAVRAPHAGAWLGAVPSRNLDLLMTNGEIRSRVGRRLGAAIGEEGPCPFCMQCNDEYGIHPECCMGGGDKVTTRNMTRNTFHQHAKAAGARPQLEQGGLLAGRGLPGGEGRRPADTLLCSTEGIQAGRRRTRARIALDIGIVCPQAPSHRSEAVKEMLGAAESYTRAKAAYEDTEAKCDEAGFEYQPIVFESFGGMAREAERVLKSINRQVAVNTNTPPEEVARRLWERLSVDLQRAGHRAFARRETTREFVVGSGMRGALAGIEGLIRPST